MHHPQMQITSLLFLALKWLASESRVQDWPNTLEMPGSHSESRPDAAGSPSLKVSQHRYIRVIPQYPSYDHHFLKAKNPSVGL